MGEEKSRKVVHVKKATQSRRHTCHFPGCGRQCPPAMWGCKSCWFKLPKYLRDKIWVTYTVGQENWAEGEGPLPTEEYLAVAREVQDWIAANYPETRSLEHE